MRKNNQKIAEGVKIKNLIVALQQSIEFLTILPTTRLLKQGHSLQQNKKITDKTSIQTLASSSTSNFLWLEKHGWAAAICGLLIGTICALCALATSLVLPHFLCACLTIACSIIVTGALHEDGLADSADGLGATRAKRIQVMQDAHIGSFATLALILSFALRAGALTLLFNQGLSLIIISLILTHAGARCAFPMWFRYTKTIPNASIAQLVARPNFFSVSSPLVLFTCIAIILLPLLQASILISVLLVASILLLYAFGKLFRGISGDLCGGGEQVLECLLLICLCSFAGL